MTVSRRTSRCALALLLGACARPAVPPAAPPEPPPPARAEPVRPEPAPIEPGRAPPAGPYAPGFDAVHYDVALALPDTGAVIRGVAVAHIAVVPVEGDRPHAELALDFTGLLVERVQLLGRGDVAARYEAGRLRIPVPAGVKVGDTLRVAVAYRGTPDDGLILRRTVHGRPAAFADNWPDRARFWFPAIDHPSDKASVTFSVAAAPGRRVIGNGAGGDPVLRGPPPGGLPAGFGSLPDSADWTVWSTNIPIPTYTMVIGATEFAVAPAGSGCARVRGTCVDVTTWLFPEDSARGRPSFRRADRMVEFYSRLVDPFPYEKLAHVQSSTRFGGMENVSAIFYDERAINSGQDIEATVAHETAHQWFGDAVTEADWHHLWLSEGFATYFGALFFEQADSVQRFRQMMEQNRQRYARSDVVSRPIVDPAERNLFELLNPNAYQKGAWVLHMLRGVLGDSVFFAGVRRYYREHLHGTALTDDLRQALERASGRDLVWFFDQWVFRPGHPQLRASWRRDRQTGITEITIEQVQPMEWPTFRLPLTVEILAPGGTVRRTLELTARREVLRVTLPAEPSTVRLDPEGWILKEVVG